MDLPGARLKGENTMYIKKSKGTELRKEPGQGLSYLENVYIR